MNCEDDKRKDCDRDVQKQKIIPILKTFMAQVFLTYTTDKLAIGKQKRTQDSTGTSEKHLRYKNFGRVTSKTLTTDSSLHINHYALIITH